MFVSVLLDCISVHHICAWCLQKWEEKSVPWNWGCRSLSSHVGVGNCTQVLGGAVSVLNCWAVFPAPFPFEPYTTKVIENEEDLHYINSISKPLTYPVYKIVFNNRNSIFKTSCNVLC